MPAVPVVVTGQPPVELLDAAGNTIFVEHGVVIPANNKSLLIAASDGANARHLGAVLDGSLYRLQTQTLLKTGHGLATEATLALADGRLTTIDAVLDLIKDTDGIKKIVDALPAGTNRLGSVRLVDVSDVAIPVADDTAIPANTKRILVGGKDNADKAQTIELCLDAVDGIHRLAVVGKVSVATPTPPVGTTGQQIEGTPLDFTGSDDTVYTIPDDETLTIQTIEAGAEGDPTEKGSKVEVFYTPDGGTTEKIIGRIYVTGQTITIYPDTDKARDGTTMVGVATNDGQIIIRRTHFGGSSKEFDVVVRGFRQAT